MPADRVAVLEDRLLGVADESKQRWWTNYVKGATFVGVPMAQVRDIARQWYHEDDTADPVGTCLRLGSHPTSELKLAGIAIMERDLVPSGAMDIGDLERVRATLSAGGYDDWNTCDWLCVKVIGRIVDGATRSQHDDVLAWTDSDVLWEKRAGLVGFVNLLPNAEPSGGFDGAYLDAASAVVTDVRRFAQTAAGWTLRELSHREPDLVRGFVHDNSHLMSSEAIANAKRLLDF